MWSLSSLCFYHSIHRRLNRLHPSPTWFKSPWPTSGTTALFPLRTYFSSFPGCHVGSGHCLGQLFTKPAPAVLKFNLQAMPLPNSRHKECQRHAGYISTENPLSLSLTHFQFSKRVWWHYAFVFNDCLGMSKSEQLLPFHFQWVSLVRLRPFQKIWPKYLVNLSLLHPIHTLLPY